MADTALSPPPKTYQIREAGKGDRGFIFKTYLQGGHTADMFKAMHPRAFEAYGARLLEDILLRSQAVVLCDKANTDDLRGFAIVEWPFRSVSQMVLHFAFVKLGDRANGLCTAMLKALGHDPQHTNLFCSHMTGQWRNIGKDKFGAIYNPLMLFPQYQTEKKERA